MTEPIENRPATPAFRRKAAALGLPGVLVIGLALVLAGASGPPLLGGDFCEYLQMTGSFANHGSPELRPEDVRPLLRPCPGFSLFIDAASRPPRIGPYFLAWNGQYHSYHFWGYSLAAVPATLTLRALGASEWTAFPVTNAVMLMGALTCIALLSPLPPHRRIVLVALTAVSPALWFLRWPHPEVFCYALVTTGLVLAARERWAWAAVVIGVASWQAPPLLALIAWVVARAARHGRRPMILAGLYGGAVALVPVALSLWGLGTPSMLASRSSSVTLVSVQRVLELMVEPNIGMWMYAPVALTLLVFAALWGLVVRHTVSPSLPLLAVLLVMMALASTTTNWNHGTAGPSRYVVWMLPLVFHGVVSMRTPPGRGWRMASGLALLVSVVAQAGSLVALGGMTPRLSYLEHSPLAQLMLRKVPSLYNPSAEIFLERTRHQEDPSPLAVFFDKGRCRKALVSVSELGLLEAICGVLPDSARRRRDATPPEALVYVDFPKRMPAASAAARRAALAPSSLSAWLALGDVRCDAPRLPQCDVVTLDVGERAVRSGGRLHAVVNVRPVATVEGAELYLGVTLPDGRRFIRDPAGILTISDTRHGLSRADRGGLIGAPGDAGALPVCDVEIGPDTAVGTYEVFAVVAKPARATRRDVDLRDVIAWSIQTVVVNH